jgi:transposase
LYATREVLQVLGYQMEQIEAAVGAPEQQLLAWHNRNAVTQRLAGIPGIGPILATAITTTVADPRVFRSGRDFAAWLGVIGRTVEKIEDLLGGTGANLMYAGYPYDPFAPDAPTR